MKRKCSCVPICMSSCAVSVGCSCIRRPCVGKNLPVIALNLGNLSSTAAAESLNEKGIAVRAGFHCAALAHRKMHTDRDGVVRVSLGAFNTRAQADACCAAVRAILS